MQLQIAVAAWRIDTRSCVRDWRQWFRPSPNYFRLVTSRFANIQSTLEVLFYRQRMIKFNYLLTYFTWLFT